MRKQRPTATFVFPRVEYHTGDPPLGIAYVAAALRQARPDIDVRLVDGTFLGDEKRLIQAVEATGPSIVGVFIDSLSIGRARRIGRIFRDRGCFTLAGGPMASVSPEILMGDFDAVLIGEAESLIADLVEAALSRSPLDAVPNLVFDQGNGEACHTRHEPCGPELDGLAWPAWDLLDMENYLRRWPYLDSVRIDIRGTNVVASRGCPWACTYCQPTLNAVFGKRVRSRSPEDVVGEIEELQGRYGVEGIFFHDDTLLANRQWTLSLCDALLRLRRPLLWGCNSRADTLTPELIDALAAAGMRNVHIGIEAGSERVRREIYDKHVDIGHLERMLDRLEQRGVSALGFFMLGGPTETLSEMLETVRLAQRLRLREATFSLTSVLPGTYLYDRVVADPRFTLIEVEGGIDYYNGRNFEDRDMPMGDNALRTLQITALAAFYLHPRRVDYLLRHLTSPNGLTKLTLKAERFLRPLLNFGR